MAMSIRRSSSSKQRRAIPRRKLFIKIYEVRSGGSYMSQNDLRVHFGIGKAEKIDLLEIRWPSGAVDALKDINPNQLVTVKEGEGIVRSVRFDQRKNGKK